MKKTLYIILIVLNLFLFALVVHCAVEHPSPNNYINELKFSKATNGSYYSIVDCIPGVEKEIEIPSSYENLPVTHIAANAFSKCSEIEEIMIPDSITVIEENAFTGCDSLEKISVDKANDIYNSIFDCNAVIKTSSKTLIVGTSNTVIPEIVESIGNSAFKGRKGLTKVELPKNVVSIGNEAFANCSNLTSFTLTKNIIALGDKIFAGCTSLSSLKVEEANIKFNSRNNCNAIIDSNNKLLYGCSSTVVPSDVLEIGSNAFYGINRLSEMVLPNSVTSIGEYAFAGCSGLRNLILSEALTTIQNNAFEGCSSLTKFHLPKDAELGEKVLLNCVGLTEITVSSENSKYDSRDNCNAVVDSQTNTILYACSTTSIPKTVAAIAPYAFASQRISEIVLPKNIILVNENAFNGCSILKKVVLLNKQVEIKNNAFKGCDAVERTYYYGDIIDWLSSYNNISKLGNETLYDTFFCYSQDEPTKEGDYWHYGEDGEIVDWK